MRKFWFHSKLAAATLCFAVLLLAGASQAQNDNDSGRDESRSSARSGGRSTAREQRNENNSGSRSWQNSRSNRQQGHSTLGVVLYNDDSNPLEIRRVLPDSAAEDAGLERGDEILTINGRRVSNVEQLKRAIERAGTNEEIEIGILRDGRRQTVDASLSTRRFARGRSRGQGQWNEDQYRSQQHGQMRSQDNQGYTDEYANEGNEWGDRDERFANRGQQYGENYGQAGNRGYSRGSRRAGDWQDDEQDDRYSEGYRGNQQSDRAFLGVTLDERARDRVRVSGVFPESPADEAGIRRGDEIVAIDDEEVESNRDLQRVLSQRDPDDEVTISVERNGRERTLQATLVSQREMFGSNRASNRTGRRGSSYQQNYGERDSYRDGNSNNRRRQRDDSQEENDDY